MASTHLQQSKITDSEFNTCDNTSLASNIRRIDKITSWFSRRSSRMTRLTSWIQRRTSWSKSAKRRGEKAIAILEGYDQIRYINPGHYSVHSQSQPGLYYTVTLSQNGNTCDCPDHMYRNARCKHILSVCAYVTDKNAVAVYDASEDGCEASKIQDDSGKQACISDYEMQPNQRSSSKQEIVKDDVDVDNTIETVASPTAVQDTSSTKDSNKTDSKIQQEKDGPKQKQKQKQNKNKKDTENITEQNKIEIRKGIIDQWEIQKQTVKTIPGVIIDEDGVVHIYPVNEEKPVICRHKHNGKRCRCTKFIKYGHQVWYVRVGNTLVKKYRQRWQCADYKHVFVYRAGMERMRREIEEVCDMLDDHCTGKTPKNIVETWARHDKSIHRTSVHKIIRKFTRMLDEYVNILPLPNLGDRFCADEIFVDIRHKEHYVFSTTDRETRFLLAHDVATKKDGYEATELLKSTAIRAGKIPNEFTTDKLGSYSIAHKNVFEALNPLWNDSEHIADADAYKRGAKHTDNAGINKPHNKKNNNTQERFNSTQRTCYHTLRGIKRTDSYIFSLFGIWFNFVRVHSSIQCTPAQAAGIMVHGTDKWRTLIGNACMAGCGT